MNKLPRDIILIISKMHPLLIPPFTNDTLRRAVKDYLAGGDRKKRIVEKYGEISNWDTSRVTYMNGLFHDARSFNQPLNNWNVSNVRYMDGMFRNARSFNQPGQQKGTKGKGEGGWSNTTRHPHGSFPSRHPSLPAPLPLAREEALPDLLREQCAGSPRHRGHVRRHHSLSN